MKIFLKTILRLYDIKIIIGFLTLFLICIIKYFQFIPDFFEFKKINNPESFLITLWTVIVGSSSVILTILLVVYSSFSKKIKRNSLDFILQNPWIKLVFSLFAGSFLFISLSIAAINAFEKVTITLLYFSSIITVLNILIQFPLIILSLKYSNSHKRIRKLIKEITQSDISELFSPSKEINDDDFIEYLEQNKLILLKDIGIHAIKEDDWGLPQNIINELYSILIKPLNKESKIEELRINLNAFCFVANHFKTHAISNSDFITTKVILHLLYSSHFHFAKNEIRKLRRNPIDNCIKDFHRLIIQNNDFYNIQQYLIRDLTKVIKAHFESIKYSDEELPTMDYNLDNRDKGVQRLQKSEEMRDYWFYVTHELPDLVFDDLKLAIETGNKNIYEYFNWKLHSLFDIVYNSKTLTEHQMNDVFDDYFYKAGRISELAIENGIYDNIDIVSNIQIENWLIKERKKALHSLFHFIDLIKRLNSINKLTEYYIDELFIIARKISGEKFNSDLKQSAVRYILETGYLIHDEENTPLKIKIEMVKQLKWLNGYLKDDKDLSDLKNEYSDRIENIENPAHNKL